MSVVTRQALILAASGLMFSVIILVISRQRKLSFRFIVGWLFLGLSIMLSAVFVYGVIPLSDALGLTPATLGLAAGVLIPVGIAVELSVTASRQQNQIRHLVEELALLDDRLNELEKQKSGTPP
ncbi:MAG: DUF2304 domain-containing protein [Ilumatobacteraceae bacterium]|nr:DUF2304 domain-containing protein [Ilumatobacteraceae bacterium]